MGTCCSSENGKDCDAGRSKENVKSVPPSLIPPTNARSGFTARSGHTGGTVPVTMYAFQDNGNHRNSINANNVAVVKVDPSADRGSFSTSIGHAQHEQAYYHQNPQDSTTTLSLTSTPQTSTANGAAEQTSATINSSIFFSVSSRSNGVASPTNAAVIPGTSASTTFFSKKPSSSHSSLIVSEAKIAHLFERYREKGDVVIQSEGILKLCQDLKLQPDDFLILLFAWKLDAQQMGRFSKEEFLKGCKTLRVDSIKGIQQRLPELLSLVQQNEEAFKELYRFAYRFALDSEVGQRTLSLDMAIQLWRLSFSQRKADGSVPPILEKWLNFLKKNSSTIRGIPKDTWNMFLNFVDSVDENFNGYSPLEAWPSLFDDFVEYEIEQQRLFTLAT